MRRLTEAQAAIKGEYNCKLESECGAQNKSPEAAAVAAAAEMAMTGIVPVGKMCLKSPCTPISASSAVLAVQGLLRQILIEFLLAPQLFATPQEAPSFASSMSICHAPRK